MDNQSYCMTNDYAKMGINKHVRHRKTDLGVNIHQKGRMLLPFMFFMFIHPSIQYAFESCTDDNAKPFGNCTVRQRDGAIGSESVNTVILKDGYLDMGLQNGCPFVNDSCRSGFSFYGWLKVFDYPKSCDAFAIYVSSGQFNIHILGNGHLAAYVWMANDTEWYVESLQPILLNIFYPIVLQFHYFGSKNGSLQLIMQDQLSGVSNCSQFRTYKPPKQNLLFGGDGVSIDHSAYVKLDRSRVSNPVSSIRNAMAELIDPPARQSACSKKPHSILTRSFQCFWVQDKVSNWSTSYSLCNSTVYDDGYPYGRLARFPDDNETIWQSVAKNLPSGKSFWLGGGKQLHWMNEDMQVVGNAHVPNGVKWIPGKVGCLIVDTKATPWAWTEVPCNLSLPAVCEMSWDCLLKNPCKNLGACIPLTDGPTCRCFPGTSGKYCEKYSGMPRPFCVNGCPCPQPQQCLVTQPVQQTTASETSYLNTQNQCYTSQIINLKATITEYYLNYNLQWESQVRQNFTLIWNKWHAAATTDVSEWKLCLNVALNIKIMLYYKNVIFEQISIKIKIDQCVSNMVPIVDIVQRLKINYNKKELIDWSDFFDDIDDLISFEN